ncbi:MAG: mechanosensitive ion channel family protein [Phycisphaerae bacterium]|nr:mechanosensitive ion channel family protein [Phycisphaerae bacterium]
MKNWLIQFIADPNLSDPNNPLASQSTSGHATLIMAQVIGIILVAVLAWVANWIAKKIILRGVHHAAERTRTQWDDQFVKHKVFMRLSHLAPSTVIYLLAPLASMGDTALSSGLRTSAFIYMVVVGWLVVDAVFNALTAIYNSYEFAKRIPIRSFVQVAKILLGLTGLIVVLSILLKKDPSRLLTGMGAMTAILLLIFKDSILGLVAGVQLSSNNMVHLGDWIEMAKYGADGDVIDISLTTIKVQNWDKTISTIPAYALISDSFKNWRGMSESGGRRIKRNITIDMNTIRFCDETMLEKFRKLQYLAAYIEEKQKELASWNTDQKVDPSDLVNGRRLTNIGTFRAYLAAYLKHHPKIHQDMTFLVRHLEPTALGLPIQIYVFSSDQVWANYEAIQADIFDHILAILPEFGLRVYQQPSGVDVQKLRGQGLGVGGQDSGL